jgi:hypothetical protein
MRFYMKRELLDTSGDNSVFFSFTSFFPNILRPYIDIVSTYVYEISTKIGVVPKLYQQSTGTMLDKSIEIDRKK